MSTSPNRCGICAGAVATTSPADHGTTSAPGSATAATVGSVPPVTASRSGASATSTQLPSVVMPTGMTSYRDRSMADSMLPPPMQDTWCSGPRPPNTTATRTLRCCVTTPPTSIGAPASYAVTLGLGRSACKQPHGLAYLQAVVHHRGDHLGDRHFHVVPAGELAHRLR